MARVAVAMVVVPIGVFAAVVGLLENTVVLERVCSIFEDQPAGLLLVF
jgi:hypothetical protein